MKTSTTTGPLSAAQLKQFAEDGFTFLGRVLDDSDLSVLRKEEARFRQNAHIAADQKNRTLFFSQVCPYSEDVRKVGTTGTHLDAIEQLIGPNLMLWYTQFVTKMPDGETGKSEFPWHQDNGYVGIEPPRNVTVWVALDDVDTENGCVWVMPKSHLNGLLPHKRKAADSWFLELKVEGDGIPAIMKAGEGIAFTGLTLHRSKLNRTGNARRAFFFEYCDPDADAVEMGKAVDGRPAERSPVVERPGTWLVRGQLPLKPPAS